MNKYPTIAGGGGIAQNRQAFIDSPKQQIADLLKLVASLVQQLDELKAAAGEVVKGTRLI